MLIIITIVTIISPLHPCTVVNVICDEGAYSDWTINRQLAMQHANDISELLTKPTVS